MSLPRYVEEKVLPRGGMSLQIKEQRSRYSAIFSHRAPCCLVRFFMVRKFCIKLFERLGRKSWSEIDSRLVLELRRPG